MTALAPTSPIVEAESTASKARVLISEVNSAGGCSHPIRLQGSTVNLSTGEMRNGTLSVACKDRRAVLCPSCSYLYKADAWVLVATGLNGGKGVSESVSSHPRLFVTLTAPSFGSVHRSQAQSSRCHPGRKDQRCAHGNTILCEVTHEPGDPILGSPICTQCFDYMGAVLWNAHASRLWNRTMNKVRRSLAEAGGLTEKQFCSEARVNYLRVAELQHRGLLHFHVILRVDGGEGSESAPPSWLTTELLVGTIEKAVHSFKVETKGGRTFSWGIQHQIEVIRPNEDEDRRAASYLAKYATKTTDGSAALARRFNTRQEIERARVSEHLRTLVLTAWDLGARPEHEDLNLRNFAHCLGYRGHLLTKSQGYSTTFAQLRRTRTEHQRSKSQIDPIEGTFDYVERGYRNPAAEQLAAVAFAARRELKRARLGSRPVPNPAHNVVPNDSELGKRGQEISPMGMAT